MSGRGTNKGGRISSSRGRHSSSRGRIDLKISPAGKSFDPNKSKEDLLAIDPHVPENDWIVFVNYYKIPQIKKLNEQNMLKVSHVGVSMSNARRDRHMEKISENLSQDQECVVIEGVSSKINVYPDDVIGKVYGAEHSGRVCGLGVCPTSVFKTRKYFAQFDNVGSSSQKNIEELQKEVRTLKENLNGYEETKEQL